MSFPFHQMGRAEFAGDLPAEADLVVIGGGVIGVSAALFAARRGLSVVLLEKGRVAAEQSSRNWGWIRVQGRDLAEIPVALEAQALWRTLDVECRGRLGLRTLGVTYLARDDKEMADFEAWRLAAEPLSVGSEIWDRKMVAGRLGKPMADWVGALHTPGDMKGEPWVAVPELARLARAEGAVIRESCAVRALDIEAGRVAGVVTEAGRIRAGAVILAGGAWSSLFLRRHGLDIPQLSVRSSVMATGPLPQVVGTAAADDRLAFRPRADGGYTLAPAAFAELFLGPDALRHLRRYLPLALSGEFDVHLRAPQPRGWPDAFTTPRQWSAEGESPFERMRILDPVPNRRKLARVARRFAETYPALGEVPVAARWAGMIDVLPDVVPVVDRVGALPGLTVATGMCGHGFGIGPGFGRVAVDLATGGDPGHDHARFRMGRFFDGTRLRPGPNL
ncbi:NAD(P)/FAD-dependent oxidoreductase [Mameliella sediminis]|uniref:NAD(P)/FAD-dependent oxidoreductase n=1 Tax=Mameliella sediminis TaxID=2836866 RepID=UPI001C47093A|nr:FAD-binding oxidoreductase [Mameliella sediminis]MBV7393700.1 FAD-binding oxidoreductase [Mameliella sediminis]